MRPLLPFLLLATVLASALLAGCTGGGRDGPVAREDLSFPVASRVAGVEPTAAGDLNLTGADGVLVTPSRETSSVTIGLAAVVQTNVFQACRAECRNLSVLPGAIVAESHLASLRNASLNAAGPEGDSALFFYDGGQETGRFLRWSDQVGKFQMNGDLQVVGNVTGTSHVGTITPLVVGNGAVVTVSTAATESTEVTVFARGSGRLMNGTGVVQLPSAFTALVGEGPITAQVTLTSRGPTLYVAEATAERLLVQNASGPGGDATFDWFVQAVRKGGEGFQP